MGEHGPVPKRSAQRAGHRAKADRPDKVTRSNTVKAPAELRTWGLEARRWYRSLTRSGQALYFEPSDWEQARIVARLLSAEMAKDRPSGAMMGVIFAAMDRLGTTEGARRRMGIEIEHPGAGAPADDEDHAGIAVLDQWREIGG